MAMTYHLGSSDGPGNIINPIQLRGENYDEWARAIQTSLKAKRKFGFVEGTVPKPTAEEKLEDWIAVHSMLVSWLTNTIELSVRSTLGEYDDTTTKRAFCNPSMTTFIKSMLLKQVYGNSH
ncbi:Retrovirus-related Pol polyprotein from transposon TNT 1-94 [Abeliophyllum distichum]|uniref:Retrovirus-related Pol polyprotein from transposon TNT 1-94 n=1 Tax=Abeliophyllum distichum TaxID=126358 RepID=A0ABD1RVY2_9LAMI